MNRILHVGAGPLGQRIINELVERQVGQIAGVVDSSPALAGRPVADFAPGADPKVRVLPDLAAFTDWDRVDTAVVATASDLATCTPVFRALLERGLPIVSTCEELIYPWLRHVALAEELEELARKSGGRLLGTGVNPGFLMDLLPSTLTSVCKHVRSVSCFRVQDAAPRRIPFQKKIGAGLSEDQFWARVNDGSLRHVGLGESLHFIAHYVGLPIERWDENIEPVKADRALTCALGEIPRGHVAGVRQVARGYSEEHEVVRLEFQAAIGQREPHDRVVVHGEPDLELLIPGGVHGDTATCAIVVNSIPRVMAAPAGLHTMATIPPPIHVRAHMPRR